MHSRMKATLETGGTDNVSGDVGLSVNVKHLKGEKKNNSKKCQVKCSCYMFVCIEMDRK